MQLVDLRTGPQRHDVTLELRASMAAELLRILAAFAQEGCEGFDVGEERLLELRATMPPALLERLDAESSKTWFHVICVVPQLPAPGTVADLLELATTSPAAIWRAALTQPLESIAGYDPAPVDGFIAGTTTREELAAHVEAALGECDEWCTELLDDDPATFGRRIGALLADVHAAVGERMLAEAAGPIDREVAAREAQLADGTPLPDVVVQATNGYELSPDLPIDHVVLMPSYWFRPWIIVGRSGRTEVLSSLVADEQLSLPSAAPPPSLVKLCKALGDEGRLRLLRRMGGGSITLADAMDELDVAKTTAHHHLSILRQAGLVVISGEGRDTCYGLRTDPPAAATAALQDYLGQSSVLAVTNAT